MRGMKKNANEWGSGYTIRKTRKQEKKTIKSTPLTVEAAGSPKNPKKRKQTRTND